VGLSHKPRALSIHFEKCWQKMARAGRNKRKAPENSVYFRRNLAESGGFDCGFRRFPANWKKLNRKTAHILRWMFARNFTLASSSPANRTAEKVADLNSKNADLI
jgi:hypothetical protein